MIPYSEQLKDPRWQKKRLEILEASGWRCEDCGAQDKTLHVHHCHYLKGKEPWEYSRDLLMTLCDQCHEQRASLEGDAKLMLARIMRSIRGSDHGGELHDFVSQLSNSENLMYAK